MELNSTEATDLISPMDNANSGYSDNAYIHFTVAAAIALCLCLIGLVGNVIIFWYLCFKIQRNKYTIYIINLAVADSIFILFSAILLILQINTLISAQPDFQGKSSLYLFIEIFYDSMQYSGMFLLTAISMERCISVLFPFWYQCHRPQNLSTIMCAFLWVIGCLESLIENIVCTPESFMNQTSECTAVEIMTFVLAIGICLPIMVISSFTLFIKIKKDFSQDISTELYVFIIATVIVFILSVIPFNFLWFLMYFQFLPNDVLTLGLFYASIYGTVLNCTINPYIYFFSERKCKLKSYKPETKNNTDTTIYNIYVMDN